MTTRHHLRRRILGGFVVFGLTIVVFSIGTFVKAYYDGQDSLQTALVRAEVARIRQEGTGSLPRQSPLFAYTDRNQMSAWHRELTAGLPDGLHEIDVESGPAAERDLAVWVGRLGKDPIWVIFDVADVETIPRIARDYFDLALAYGAVLLIFGGWLAHTISKRISEPLEHFAGEIRAQPPGQWRGDFADRYGDGEVGAVASALDTTIRRNRDFLERERVFMQNASHELRTPLTVVSGAAEVLKTLPEIRNSRASPVVERVHRAARDMRSLTEAFLWLGRESDPESAHIACSVDTAVKGALRHTLHLLDGKPVEVRIHQDADIEVPCRPELLEIGLANLLRNAFQHVESGHVDVRIEPDAVEVVDTGPGLPTDATLTYTARGHHGGASRGFGIGLAIVGQVCERMNWSFRLENRPEGGCLARIEGLGGRRVEAPS